MNESSPALGEIAAVDAQIARIDALLAEGREAVARLDRFYAEHGIQPGIGAQQLQSEDVPERHRIIFARLLAELQRLEHRVEELDPSSKIPAPVPVITRAVGNRYRI
ncbi:hypothetical protein [Prosthecobacter vanneervenii]|uniref:Uncharacterized protein n=1 Tax=Prosthecobacter vanneervenii TaxID=48466 RepID=A0A7W7Y8L4_9BACT|nr:hypothetical protein [Prosthecobacter vanneervenii]MBB5031245.1 hypothetical protein [Prosthecobacter vanneervenii]